MTRSMISNHIKKKWEIKYVLISDEQNNGGEEKKTEKDFQVYSI